MSNPVSYERLVALAAGWLPTDEQETLRAVVAADPGTARLLADLERTIALLRPDPAEAVPEYVVGRAIRIYRTPERAPGLVQRLIARLQPTGGRMLAPGFRTGSEGPRQWLYSVADRDIALQIAPTGDTWAIMGQVLGPQEAGQVELRAGNTVLGGALNELGEFELQLVEAGTYTLLLRQGALEIECQNVVVA